MKAEIIGLLSETSIHPGSESAMGAVDLPIAREASTNYPVITGSSLKGAFRESFEYRRNGDASAKIFGEKDRVGEIAITDGRILLLPVRSLIGHYKWVTCPYILDRFQRDLKLAGFIKDGFSVRRIEQGKALCNTVEEDILLEEIVFKPYRDDNFINKLIKIIKPLLFHVSLRDRLLDQLIVINDDEFVYFAKYGVEIRDRNKLEKNTKQSENLWYEECLPSDTLFYSLCISRFGNSASLKMLKKAFLENPYIQIGGNETVGQGWCILNCWEGDVENE